MQGGSVVLLGPLLTLDLWRRNEELWVHKVAFAGLWHPGAGLSLPCYAAMLCLPVMQSCSLHGKEATPGQERWASLISAMAMFAQSNLCVAVLLH